MILGRYFIPSTEVEHGPTDNKQRFHPNAEIYSFSMQSISSVLSDIKATQPLLFAASGMPRDHHSLMNPKALPEEVLAPLKLQVLFDSIPARKPDFMFLGLHSVVLDAHTSGLVDFLLVLLGQGYSLELRLFGTENAPVESAAILYVLATPTYFQLRPAEEMSMKEPDAFPPREPTLYTEHHPQNVPLADMAIGTAGCVGETESLHASSDGKFGASSFFKHILMVAVGAHELEPENKAKDLARSKGFPTNIVDQIQAGDYDEVLRALPPCISRNAGVSILRCARESTQQTRKRPRCTDDAVLDQPTVVKKLKKGESDSTD